MSRLTGKVALITGAARGMGAAHAKEFVENGAKVVITDIIEDEGEQLAEELGENAIFLKLDITDLNQWNDVLNKVKEIFGTVNVLVNNAGYPGPNTLLADLNEDDYLKVITIDQHGTFYGMKAVIPHMIEAGGGSIINIASLSGLRHVPYTPNVAYTAAKHAVLGLTRAAAVEYGKKNIRVNAVCPGGILTPMMKESISQEQTEALGAIIPNGRLAEPHEVSKAVLFLASEDASYVNGEEIRVDGGALAK